MAKCLRPTDLELFDATGTQLLAGASSGADGACPVFSHPLDPGAVYALRVTIGAGTRSGHVFLEIRAD